MGRIESLFNELKVRGRKAFIPYIMTGYPSLKKTEELVLLLEDCGADVIELGVPFTDPLADGPTIQAAAERAVRRGVTLRKVLGAVGRLRRKTSVPIVLMTYFNPVFKYGLESFVDDASGAGVDGLIVPDLPPDEAGDLIRLARPRDLSTVFLLAPTSTDERIRLVSRASTGFIYYVSLTGITGAALTIDGVMERMIRKIRTASAKPVAVGFGVKSPEDARAVAEISDGVIVGSSIVRMISDNYRGLERYLTSLRRAI
ncbi:MAG TPA: tryptophan synthase subunit alpha [Nitrospirae bacterium]|nr:tryptophan synthase subunit alpha [Nitrospirota bacterium]